MIFGEIIDGLRQDMPRRNLRTFIQDSSNSLGEKPNTNCLSRTRQPGVHLRRDWGVPGMCSLVNPPGHGRPYSRRGATGRARGGRQSEDGSSNSPPVDNQTWPPEPRAGDVSAGPSAGELETRNCLGVAQGRCQRRPLSFPAGGRSVTTDFASKIVRRRKGTRQTPNFYTNVPSSKAILSGSNSAAIFPHRKNKSIGGPQEGAQV
jgi:hypothetical protein